MSGRLLRLVRAELRRLRGQRMFLGSLLLVGIAAGLGSLAPFALDSAQSRPNVFLAFAWGLRCGSLFAALAMLTAGANSLSAEFHGGMVRALLIRPVRRSEFVAAKAMGLLVLAAITMLFLVVVAGSVSLATCGWGPVTDPEVPGIVVFDTETMVRTTATALAMSLPALCVLTLVGLCVSSLVDHPGHATGIAIGLHFVLRAAAGMNDRWPLLECGLAKSNEVLLGRGQGFNDAFFRSGDLPSALMVAGVLGMAATAIATMRLCRREVFA